MVDDEDNPAVHRTVAGARQNAGARGLFREPGNAGQRREDVSAAGCPGRMRERAETARGWWLDVGGPDGAGNDGRRGSRTPGGTGRSAGGF